MSFGTFGWERKIFLCCMLHHFGWQESAFPHSVYKAFFNQIVTNTLQIVTSTLIVGARLCGGPGTTLEQRWANNSLSGSACTEWSCVTVSRTGVFGNGGGWGLSLFVAIVCCPIMCCRYLSATANKLAASDHFTLTVVLCLPNVVHWSSQLSRCCYWLYHFTPQC